MRSLTSELGSVEPNSANETTLPAITCPTRTDTNALTHERRLGLRPGQRSRACVWRRRWIVVGLLVNASCARQQATEDTPSQDAEVQAANADADIPLIDVRAALGADASPERTAEDPSSAVDSTTTRAFSDVASEPSDAGTPDGDTYAEPTESPTSDAPSTQEQPSSFVPDAGIIPDVDAGDADTLDVDASAGPSLSSLAIDGTRTALYPAFDPDQHHYSVIAEPGVSTLGVTVTAPWQWSLSVNGVALPAGERVELADVIPGSQLVFSVGTEPNSAEYVVEYLPVNFPELFVDKPHAGATDEPLYTNLDSSDCQFAVKLDDVGVPLFYREEPRQVYDFKKHPNGHYSYAVRRENRADGAHEVVLDSEFRELQRLSAVGLVNTDAHDFIMLPNGNFVFMSYEPAVRDLSGIGLSATETVIDSIFQEVTPDSQVVFQWNTWGNVQYDHSVHAYKKQDYAHGNAVTMDHDGNWLFSSRSFSQVYKIDRVTGEVVWRLGGVASDFTFVNDPFNGICGQHTPSRLENGHILIFDNSRDCLPEVLGDRPIRSRVVEYALDEEAMTAELVWSYERDGIFAQSQGSAQRLANGNTMIGWGSGSSVLATEVNPAGEVVFELTGRVRTNARLSSYRARRFAD